MTTKSLSVVSLIFFTTFAAFAAVTDGLVSYWPLDATNSGTTPDALFTNTLSVVGPVTVASGQLGNAFTLNGTTTYLTNLHATDRTSSGLPIYPGGSYTIMMWVKGAAQTAKYLFTEASTANNSPLFILQTGNAAGTNPKFDVIIRNDAGATLVNHVASTTTVFDNTWHHIAFVDDQGSARLYVDGNLDAANFSYAPAGTFTVNSTAIGTLVRAAIATGNIFNGQMDDVILWERALSQAEVNQVRTSHFSVPVTPTVPTLFAIPSDATRHLGDWQLFSVSAYSIRPHNVITYQWSKNGTPITDATNRTYRVTGLMTNNTGDFYSVAVTNDLGGVSSTNATLTVLDDPAPNTTNGIANYWPLNVINQVDTNLMSPELHYGQSMVLRGFVDTNDFVLGQYGNALAFDFATKYGFRTNGTSIYNATNYTVSLWVQADFTSQNDRRVFSEGSSSSGTPLFTIGTDPGATSSSASIFIRNDANAAVVNGRKSARAVFDNTWHHLVWTDANGQGKLYVDGVLDETDYTYTRNTTTLNITSIGAVLRSTGLGNFYFGNIDEVATWGRVLSWTEIQQVKTNGVPVPQGVVAPTISVQPPERTNNVFRADDVFFPVQVVGSEPLLYHWRKNGADISSAVNPTALTSTLVVSNVSAADSNTTYSVTVTNDAGSVTSSIVHLYVQPWSPVTNGEALDVDFGLTGTPNAQPGFQEMTLGGNPASFTNTVRVTISAINGIALAERDRIVAPLVFNNPPYLTHAQLYNDFIFGNSPNTTGTGIRILIDRLATNVNYAVTIWSFDPVSAGTRVSDWTETSSGTPLTVANAYTFSGNVQPTNDFEATLGGIFTSSATGQLQFEGVRNAASVDGTAAASFGVFLNAIRLVANPVDHTRVIRGEMAAGNLRVTAAGEYPNQLVNIQQTTNLAGGVWVPAVGGTPVSTNGAVVKVDFSIDPTQPQLFYRGQP